MVAAAAGIDAARGDVVTVNRLQFSNATADAAQVALADAQATMTQTAAVIGTAQYVSPEQARGETVDNRSDVYSVGCLLFELLTGRTPYVGEPISLTYQHVNADIPLPSSFEPETNRVETAPTRPRISFGV